MNNWIKIIILFYIMIRMAGCSSEEPISPKEQPAIPNSDNVYLEQNRWIYAQMNENYLWRQDLPDSIDCNYDLSPKDFFRSLLSDKDRFSYLTFNDDYRPQQNWGFAYLKYKDRSGKEASSVIYVSSERVRNAGLHRGDWVRVISNDGFCLRLKKVRLEGGKFHDMENSAPIVLSLGDLDNNTSNVLCDSVYDVNGRRIAYLCYLKYEDTPELHDALIKFKQSQVSDLILDLRYNPGGYVSTCRYLCNSIIPSSGYKGIFQQCSYNDIISQRNLKETGNERTFSYFHEPYPDDVVTLEPNVVPLEMKRIFVLTSSHTASASEATVVCLRPYLDVIVIGEPTVGKNVGSWNISDRKYKYSIQPITMKYYNSLGETTPNDGLVPDYFIEDGYSADKRDIGDILEPMLNFTMSLIDSEISGPVETVRSQDSGNPDDLTPVGNPSFVTEFNNGNYDK